MGIFAGAARQALAPAECADLRKREAGRPSVVGNTLLVHASGRRPRPLHDRADERRHAHVAKVGPVAGRPSAESTARRASRPRAHFVADLSHQRETAARPLTLATRDSTTHTVQPVNLHTVCDMVASTSGPRPLHGLQASGLPRVRPQG